eukprot:1160880-Pelagomonas_calceolata.AAC.9
MSIRGWAATGCAAKKWDTHAFQRHSLWRSHTLVFLLWKSHTHTGFPPLLITFKSVLLCCYYKLLQYFSKDKVRESKRQQHAWHLNFYSGITSALATVNPDPLGLINLLLSK